MNPARGSITITLAPADEGVDLPTDHLIAPWPADEHCLPIAAQALEGMGWRVVGEGTFAGDTGDPEVSFTLDVAPADRPDPARG